MGKRGPRSQPTTLKALRGTIRTPDRRRGPDALAPGGRIVAPKYFTAAMRKRWRQILHDAPLNVLRPIDSAILTDFVVNEALAEQALAECGGELVVEGEKAKARNPYLLVYFKAIEAKRAAMRELGFTPAARVGLPIEDSGNADPEDERWRWLVELGEKDKAERARLAKPKKTKREALLATQPATPEVQ